MLRKSKEILKLRLDEQQENSIHISSKANTDITAAVPRDESRVEQLRRVLEEKERAECTFEPKLISDQRRAKNATRNYGNIFNKLHSDHHVVASKPPRETTEENEQKNCTFKPQNFSSTYFAQISASKERSTEPDERYGSATRASAKSEDKHVYNMRKGRKLYDEKKAQKEESDWRHYSDEKAVDIRTPQKVTESEPFQFRTKHQAEIRSAANYRKQILEVQAQEMQTMQDKHARNVAKEKSDAVAARGKCLRRYERNRNVPPLLQVEVMVAQGRTENLKVWHLDDADDVAAEFAKLHRLPYAAAKNLSQNLKMEMAKAHMKLVSHKSSELMNQHASRVTSALYSDV